MTQENYKKQIEERVIGLKVLQIKSEKNNPYSGILFEYDGVRFQIVGNKLKNLDIEGHVLDIEFAIKNAKDKQNKVV